MANTALFDTRGQFPSISPAWVLFVYVIIPWIPIIYNVRLIRKRRDRTWNGGKIYSFLCNLAYYLYQNAPYFAIGQLSWTVVLLVNQGIFAYSNLKFGYDLSYYSRVDSGPFNSLDSISFLASFNSLDALNGGNGDDSLFRRRQRRLQISSIDSNLTIAYHFAQWENALSEEALQNICYTERNILNTPGCINTRYYSSVIPKIFDSSCDYTIPYESALALLGRSDNSLYVTDFVQAAHPESSVLLTYFGSGYCDSLKPKSFSNYLNDRAVNGTLVAYTNYELNKEDLKDSAGNTVYFLGAAVIVAYFMLALGVRGLVVPLVTLFCVFFSIVNAAALMAMIGYTTFTVANASGVLIALMYACSAVNAYGSAWRRQVKKGCHPSIPNILNSYITFGQRMLYVTTLACMCLFALMGSSVMVVNQFGCFTGFTILTFYLLLHYVVIPFWLFMSWFTLSKAWHQYLRERREEFCGCFKALNEFGLAENWNVAAMLGLEDDEDSNDDQTTRAPPEEKPEEQSIVQPDRIVFVGEDPNQPADGANAQTAVIAASLVEEEANLGESKEPIFEEAVFDTKLCRGKRPLKLIGFVILLVVLIALGIVYGVTVQNFELDTGIPQIFPEDSNLGRQMVILEKYKADLLNKHMSVAVLTGIVLQVPTVRPTAAPAGITIAPTQRPTFAPTVDTPPDNIYYSVKGCWGIEQSRPGLDGKMGGIYSFDSFKAYVDDGIIEDMQSLCNYVSNNREALSIAPEWNVTTDCIYNQYMRAYNALPTNIRSTVNGFTAWGSRTSTTSYSVGYASNANVTYPVWVCSNFTILSQVTTIGGDPDVVDKVREKWEEAFQTVSTNALSYDVPIQVASPAFTYPLLSYMQGSFLTLCLATTIIGFVVLLGIFTLADMGLTVFGALSIVAILSVSVCLHIFFSQSQLDLWDVVIVQSIMLIIVDFPVFLIEEYMAARAFVDRQHTTAIDKALSPALFITNQHVRRAIIPPFLLMIFASIPALFADLEFLSRTAEYIIIISLVSTLMTVFIQPYLLAFGCRTKFFEHLCYVEEEVGDGDAMYDLPAPAAASLPVPSPEDETVDEGQYNEEQWAGEGEGEVMVDDQASQSQYYDPNMSQSGMPMGPDDSSASFPPPGGYGARPFARQASQMMYPPMPAGRGMQPTQSMQVMPMEMERPVPLGPPHHGQLAPRASQYNMHNPGLNRVPTMMPPQPSPQGINRHASMVPVYSGPPPSPPRGPPGQGGQRMLHMTQSMYGGPPPPPPHGPGYMMPPNPGYMDPNMVPPPQSVMPGRHYGSMASMPSANDMYGNMPPPMNYPPQQGGYPPNMRRGPSVYRGMPPNSQYGQGYPSPHGVDPRSFYEAPQY